jgi:preprotein translocase subunit SecA
MIIRIRSEVVEKIFWIQLAKDDDVEEEVERLEEEQKKRKLVFNRVEDEVAKPAKSAKVSGRNDPCPCGSGKKFKKCCGA